MDACLSLVLYGVMVLLPPLVKIGQSFVDVFCFYMVYCIRTCSLTPQVYVRLSFNSSTCIIITQFGGTGTHAIRNEIHISFT